MISRNRFVGEIWELQALVYFILGIMVDKSYNNHWLAIFLWIWGAISFLGAAFRIYRAKLEEENA